MSVSASSSGSRTCETNGLSKPEEKLRATTPADDFYRAVNNR